MITAKIYTYDVWGNAEDGYEVNDVYFNSTVELEDTDFLDDEHLYWALIRLGVLEPNSEVSLNWHGNAASKVSSANKSTTRSVAGFTARGAGRRKSTAVLWKSTAVLWMWTKAVRSKNAPA